MSVQPYLFFDGRCEEAVAYYQQHLGAKLTTKLRYKETPPGDHTPPDANGEQIMYCHFTIGDSVIMASDDCMNPHTQFQGFALSHNVASKDEADRAFAALADGGHIKCPMTKTFFSPYFGMLVDKFGVNWMIVIPQET